VAAAYVVFSWLTLQIGDVVFPALKLPEWTLTLVTVLLAIGLLPALVFSWVYELTPEGVKKESEVDRASSMTPHTGKKLDYITLAALVAVVAFVVVERWTRSAPLPAPGQSDTPATTTVTADTGPAVDESPDQVADRASVAVLPFTTRSTDPEDAHFTDGIHDDLLTQLAKIASLKVISRTSVMEYRDTTKKIPEIAGELGVANILEGAVQRAGQRVRINAQLIDADTDEHLWAETFDRELTLENLFEIQSDIASSIASALQATLRPSEKEQLGRVLTGNLEAWEAYRRALRLLDGYNLAVFERAELEAVRALELDPEFAAAHAILARVHMSRYWVTSTEDEKLRELAGMELAAGRAIDPQSPELDIAEAYYHYWGFLAYDQALAALDRALAAVPNDAELFKVKGFTLRRAGRFGESNDSLRRALELDPRSLLPPLTLAETARNLGRFEESAHYLKIAEDIQPSAPGVASEAGYLLAFGDGDFDAAIHQFSVAGITDATVGQFSWFTHLAAGRFEEALKLSDLGPFAESRWAIYLPDAMRGITLVVAGKAQEAEPLLLKARADLEARLTDSKNPGNVLRALCQATGALKDLEAAQDYCARSLLSARPDLFQINFDRWEVAQGLAMAGDVDGALGVLESTLENSARTRSKLLRADPMLASLRDDPRFEPLLERIDQP
jgi:TolB-like protein